MSVSPASGAGEALDARGLAARIDHTLLRPDATAADVDRTADEAVALGCAAVCVHGVWVERVRARLDGVRTRHGVKLCAVVDFPLGCAGADVKADQSRLLALQGADELDAVALPPAVVAGDRERVRDDLAPLVDAAKAARRDVVIKAIIETAALEALAGADDARLDGLIAAACEAVRDAGCDFMKTSTGFHAAGGASIRAVALLAQRAGPLGVKASGGIRALAQARAMLAAGADRLGCSATAAILREAAGAGALGLPQR